MWKLDIEWVFSFPALCLSHCGSGGSVGHLSVSRFLHRLSLPAEVSLGTESRVVRPTSVLLCEC